MQCKGPFEENLPENRSELQLQMLVSRVPFVESELYFHCGIDQG